MLYSGFEHRAFVRLRIKLAVGFFVSLGSGMGASLTQGCPLCMIFTVAGFISSVVSVSC